MWFLRAVEVADGGWVCRHGLTEFDTHHELREALEHLRHLAQDIAPSILLVHRLDGTVERID